MAYGLLGRKLGHSHSPTIHEAFGRYAYGLFEVEPGELEGFVKGGAYDGLNVTIPYKKAVVPFCDHLDDAAREIGSVNTITRAVSGKLVGYNTDVFGFEAMLGDMDVGGKKVLVLGSGGSSLTVCWALRRRGAHVTTISRSHPHDNYDNIASRHAEAELLVNTTPVGQHPNTEEAPVDVSLLPKLEAVLDLVYNPVRTQLVLEAEARGIKALGGLGMLVEQAARACELFTGEVLGAEGRARAMGVLRSRMENIVLVGMPGCGKTVIGRELSVALGMPFLDADEELVRVAGRSIPEIFAGEGEGVFRGMESEVLAALGTRSGVVIATGGGCVTRFENYFHLRKRGRVVFLHRDISLLEREGRPLSQGSLEDMYAVRRPLYERFADVLADNDAPPAVVAQRIRRDIYKNLGD